VATAQFAPSLNPALIVKWFLTDLLAGEFVRRDDQHVGDWSRRHFTATTSTRLPRLRLGVALW